MRQEFRSWDIEQIRSIVASEDYEPDWFDFKEVMTASGSMVTESNRKVACAMANSSGGFIIFGVKDRANRKSGESGVIGLDLSKNPDLRKEFGHQMRLLQPGIVFDCSPKAIPVDASMERGVFVIEIPVSTLRPHQWDGKFWKRSKGGECIAMDVYEVRDQMLYAHDKFIKLTLLRIELAQLKNVSDKMGAGDENRTSFRFVPDAINTLVADTCTLFPNGNQLLRGLSAMVGRAQFANLVLEKLNREAALGLHSLVQSWQMDEWRKELRECRKMVSDICASTEEELCKIHGEIAP